MTTLEQAAPVEKQIAQVQLMPDGGPGQSDNAAHNAEKNRIQGSAGQAATDATVGADAITFGKAGSDKGWSPEEFAKTAMGVALELNTVGWSGKGVRMALERMGEEVGRANAADLGQQLFDSGKYDKIPWNPKDAQTGDILVRPPAQGSPSVYGDIMVITGRNAAGGPIGVNDHVNNNIQPDSNRYEGSYILRRKPGA